MGLGLEGLRQQLSEMIASSTETTTRQAPDLARTQVDNYKTNYTKDNLIDKINILTSF